MRYPTPNSVHWKSAARGIANRLANQKEPVLMFDLTSVADHSAREVGRKTDLFPDLFDYCNLLPASWTTAWLGAGGEFGDKLYYAIPRGWAAGKVEPSLTSTLMGSREVFVVDSPDA